MALYQTEEQGRALATALKETFDVFQAIQAGTDENSPRGSRLTLKELGNIAGEAFDLRKVDATFAQLGSEFMETPSSDIIKDFVAQGWIAEKYAEAYAYTLGGMKLFIKARQSMISTDEWKS